MVDHIDTRRSEVIDYHHGRQHLGGGFDFPYVSQILITVILCINCLLLCTDGAGGVQSADVISGLVIGGG